MFAMLYKFVARISFDLCAKRMDLLSSQLMRRYCFLSLYIYRHTHTLYAFLHLCHVGENVLGGRKGKRLMYLECTSASVHSHQYFSSFTPPQIPTNEHISCATIILVLFSFCNIVYIFNF